MSSWWRHILNGG